ncbi:hypothetical protein GCM10010978_07310 [Compostibacillus humi]|uniref:YCII-related domain-containing protein n=1 Tax=Compostibacillus humi TaxID=1245525 RepID=A0A8J3EK98_9BACI|nr:YciI family protein [Compostibacillus humi]GGH71412.1 hypothetical protein GCM10010978_07310 [Compostibacillus humi]
MKYFAVLLPMKDEEKSKTYRPEHLAYLEKKEEEGKVFARGRFADGTAGLVIYIADSYEEAEELTKQDPYVIHGARSYEIHEWDMITKATLLK